MEDVNPEGYSSANTNVYVWGKLLGITLVWENGNKNTSIASFFLSHLQSIICEIVAIGPKDNLKLQYQEVAIFEYPK